VVAGAITKKTERGGQILMKSKKNPGSQTDVDRESLDQEQPEVYALSRGKNGWSLSRRDLLAAAATAAAGMVAGCGGGGGGGGWSDPTGSGGIRAYTADVTGLAITPDGRLLISSGGSGGIKAWTLPEGALVKHIDSYNNGAAGDLAISSDGGTLISRWYGDICVRALPGMESLDQWYASGNDGLAMSPDGQFVALGGENGNISLRSMPDGGVQASLSGHSLTCGTLAFTPDSCVLVSGGGDGDVKLWSVPDGALLKTLSGRASAVQAVAVSPTGSMLVSGTWGTSSSDATVSIWSLPDGGLMGTLMPGSGVHTLAITANGGLLAAGTAGGVGLWSLPGGAQLAMLDTLDTVCVAVSRDGRTLASGSGSGTIKIWSLPDGQLLKEMIDLDCSYSSAQGTSYQGSYNGETVTMTLPCGSPIPAGAACVCNCVPGTISPPSDGGGGGGGGGGHYWYPN
jgi:WD40 repeat protein